MSMLMPTLLLYNDCCDQQQYHQKISMQTQANKITQNEHYSRKMKIDWINRRNAHCINIRTELVDLFIGVIVQRSNIYVKILW